jgi:hypothetical protein
MLTITQGKSHLMASQVAYWVLVSPNCLPGQAPPSIKVNVSIQWDSGWGSPEPTPDAVLKIKFG